MKKVKKGKNKQDIQKKKTHNKRIFKEKDKNDKIK